MTDGQALAREIVAVQVFERLNGELVPGAREITTRDAAFGRARTLAKSAAGAAIVCLLERDGARSATYLAAFGDVPEPYVECRVEE